MKPLLAVLLLTPGLVAPASLAVTHSDRHPAAAREVSDQPCGWRGGALPDPADTQRCLAERFKAAKPKPPKPRTAQSGPSASEPTNAE
jgi:hypothetical protein